MSCVITLTEHGTEDEVMRLNWLRNPYGLVNCAIDNANIEDGQLWHVINDSSYDKSDQVDRALFKQVVNQYWDAIKDQEQLYYWFSLASFVQFIAPNYSVLPKDRSMFYERIEGAKYNEDHSKIGIPMECLAHPSFNLDKPSTAKFKKWFQMLVEFADLLQNPEYDYYCSN